MTIRLPNDIAFLNRKQTEDFLNVAESTLRSYQQILNQLKPEGWDYLPNSPGFTRSSVEVLFQFRSLIQNLGQIQAIHQIKKLRRTK